MIPIYNCDAITTIIDLNCCTAISGTYILISSLYVTITTTTTIIIIIIMASTSMAR
jgi:hypothetical protein